MFKKLLIGILAATIVIAATASTFSALAAPSGQEIQPVTAAESIPVASVPTTSDIIDGSADSTLHSLVASTATTDETAGLLYMYEEEKLARDVYTHFFSLWGQTTFQSIATSEQAHMDAIRTVLATFGIAVPDLEAGIFNDPELQALHDNLVNEGSLSLADALKVGAKIEEIDILDLQSQLDQTTNPDLILVYNNLMMGSYNHLKSFTSVLTRITGEVYVPQYLSPELYQTILSSATGNGSRQGAGGGAMGGGSRGQTADSPSMGDGKGYRGGQ